LVGCHEEEERKVVVVVVVVVRERRRRRRRSIVCFLEGRDGACGKLLLCNLIVLK